jgi:Mg2+ and Co2+ transporter CorA
MDSPRVRTVACLGGVSLERDVPSDEIRQTIREPGNLVWVDVQDPGPAELSMLLEAFGFHPLALEDVARDRQRPKVDEYKGYVFVVTQVYFQDVYDNILRLLDTLDLEREMVSGVLDEYLSVISNRLNETMRTLTVVSVVVGTAGCVFGAWGMNLGGVPLAHTQVGFWAVSAGTMVLVTAALLISRRRGWL